MSEEKPPVCKDCSGHWYDSPNPKRKGQWEHFCQATKGVIFRKKGWPADLSKEKTLEHNVEKRKPGKGKGPS